MWQLFGLGKRLIFCILGVVGVSAIVTASQSETTVDLLLLNGRVINGTGNPWVQRDIGITGDKIVFVGNARQARVRARETVDVSGLLVTPGLWDMHSHADVVSEWGRQSRNQLYQGITTVVLGVDGGGENNVAEQFEAYRRDGIAVNVVRYVGFRRARGEVMGMADRPPTPAEMEAMKAYIMKGMMEGAVGMSTALAVPPDIYATTEEVIEVAKVAAALGGVYDTHDRDMGVTFKSIGYLNSVRETIEIGERAGLPVIFSHFNAQGPANFGLVPEATDLINRARARGVNVMAAQHLYTATNSGLQYYVLPPWADEGGPEERDRRLRDLEQQPRLKADINELIELRGGADKFVFTTQDEELNGRSLADIASTWGVSAAEAAARIVLEGSTQVMNIDLYDMKNAEYLSQQEWMMTCTDGFTPRFGEGMVHPRSYGSLTRKIASFVHDKQLISLAFAIRGMTSLGADFLGFQNRGLIKEGFFADLAVFDEANIRDKATFENPHQYSEGTVHVIVNGQFAFRGGTPTGVLAGRPLSSNERRLEP